MKKILSIQLLTGLFLIFGLGLSFDLLLAEWSAPTQNPTDGNVPKPLHVGKEGQVKDGALWVHNIFMVGDDPIPALYVEPNYVGIRSADTSGNILPLRLDIHGKIGAEAYCDENGHNCFVPGPLAGGKNYALDSRDDSIKDVVYVDPDGHLFFSTTIKGNIITPFMANMIKDMSDDNDYNKMFVMGGGEIQLENTEGGDPKLTFNDTDNHKYRIISGDDKLSFWGNYGGIDGNYDTAAFEEMAYFKVDPMGEKIFHVGVDEVVLVSDQPELRLLDHANGMSWGLRSTSDGTPSGTKFGLYGATNPANYQWPNAPAIIFQNGRTAINSLSLPSAFRMNVGGSVRADSFEDTSDIKYKENIETIKDALKKIMSIEGVYFNWKDPNENQERQFGLVAQDLEKVLPEAVFEGDFKSIDYHKLSALVIEAVKELSDEIDKELEVITEENNILKKYACQIQFDPQLCR
jgi:hypothetical protein